MKWTVPSIQAASCQVVGKKLTRRRRRSNSRQSRSLSLSLTSTNGHGHGSVTSAVTTTTMAASPYEAHLALITDLLSPPEVDLHPSVFSSLQHHVASLDDEQALLHLVKTCLQSPSLWYEGNTSPIPPQQLPVMPVSLDRCQKVYDAFHEGVLARFLRISEEYGNGWRGRRRAGSAARAILSIAQSADNTMNSLPGLTIGSAALRAVQDTAESESELFGKRDSWRSSTEKQLVQLWKASAPTLPRPGAEVPQGERCPERGRVTRRLAAVQVPTLRLLGWQCRRCPMSIRRVSGLWQPMSV